MCWLLAAFLKLFFCRLRLEGLENVPKTGGVVLACNHSLGADYVVLGYSSPRQVYYMAKSEAFTINPWLTRLLDGVGTFPIRRGERDTSAISSAVEQAQMGRVVGMFPEGTRSRTGQLQRARSGAVRIAMEADVPVVPAAVINSEKMFDRRWFPWNRPLVIVRFGEPIKLENVSHDPVAVRAVTDQVMYAVADLLPPERRGVYADPMVESAEV